jgi:hypothetical protein
MDRTMDCTMDRTARHQCKGIAPQHDLVDHSVGIGIEV